jgi:hypothetical protein
MIVIMCHTDELRLQEDADEGKPTDPEPLAAMPPPHEASTRSVSEGGTSSSSSAGIGATAAEHLPVARRIVSASEAVSTTPPSSLVAQSAPVTPHNSGAPREEGAGGAGSAGAVPVMKRATSYGASAQRQMLVGQVKKESPQDVMELRKLRAMKYQIASSSAVSADASSTAAAPASSSQEERQSIAEVKSDDNDDDGA